MIFGSFVVCICMFRLVVLDEEMVVVMVVLLVCVGGMIIVLVVIRRNEMRVVSSMCMCGFVDDVVVVGFMIFYGFGYVEGMCVVVL